MQSGAGALRIRAALPVVFDTTIHREVSSGARGHACAISRGRRSDPTATYVRLASVTLTVTVSFGLRCAYTSTSTVIDVRPMRVTSAKKVTRSPTSTGCLNVNELTATVATRSDATVEPVRRAPTPEIPRHDPNRHRRPPEFAEIEAALAGSPPVPVSWERIA